MAFRFEKTLPDGELLVVFEEEEDLETGALELVTTFCNAHVSLEAWREAQLEAQGAWKLALDRQTRLRWVRP